MRRDDFEVWLRLNSKLVEGTIISYSSAIVSLTNWANDNNIFERDIYNITDLKEFDDKLKILNNSDLYIKYNEEGHKRFSNALKYYREFIKDNTIEKEKDLKLEFNNWIKNLKKNNVPTYTDYIIKGYILALEKSCEDILDLDISSKNLFKVSSLNKFREIRKVIEKSKYFEKVNNKYGKRQLEFAMNSYELFLKNRILKQHDLQIIKEDNEDFQINSKKSGSFNKAIKLYKKSDFLSEVFISDKEYETMKGLLKRKKNLILQGAPGVGKTFVAKRLAYSIMGEKDESRVKMVQFHQSYSYEDFVMGYRPSENGFELKEGPFYEFCIKAANEPEKDFYFIIDEINRGNMSKIFGELLMLIESDKRGESLTLTYSNEEFYVPNNLYIIGMMNTADRSLAIIDYALRRRFCFVELNPAFGTDLFKEKLISQGASNELVSKIISRVGSLNKEIENDRTLGKGFRIGHSYFCNYEEDDSWYEEIIKYEIDPLLREYWFDEEEKAESYIDYLLRG
ncbi:AAA family ATPase [Clostridium perfringens]|uniref:AAA family ATPase n=2 Tax=Clostridium perfringens TaxID=1502 RepID=UPI0018E46B6D|nr:AAA family ATPase [Clostridium perfringens]MBI6065496.1 AAA family ATPase [Clostridium perfringens]